jgi:hypothetical protein
MAFDPSIIMGYKGMGEVPNPVSQLAQVSQIQASQRQGEVAKMQLEDLKNDRIEMQKFQAEVVANGGNPDLRALAQTMLRSPKTRAEGMEFLRKLEEQDKFAVVGKKLYPELFGAETTAEPIAAPTTAPAPSIMRQPGVAPAAPVAPNALGTGMYGMEPTAPVNALAPTAAPAAAPVNALAAPTGKTADQLRREIIMFSQSTDPRAKAMVDMLKAQLTEASKAQTLSPGQQLYAGGKVVYTAPEKDSEFERLLKTSGLSEPEKTRLRIQRAQKEATHAPGSSVYMPPQEKAEQADRGKMLIKQYETISETARLGSRTLPSLESNAAILSKGFDTGFGTEAKAAGAKVLGALGVKDAQNYATNAQTFLGNASSAVLQKQLEQKGPQTEADAQRITQTGAQLGNTKEANNFFIDVAKEQIKRDIDQRDFYDKWWKTKKTYDGAEDAWYSGDGSRSLFDRPGLKKYMGSTSAANQIPGQGPAAPAARTVVRTGMLNGRRVIQYSDGSTEYGN